MVLALASGRTAPTPRRLRLGSLRNGAECGGGTVAVEPRQRWQLLCGRIGPRLTQAALCACAGFACLRACALRLRLQRPCRGRKLPPANCRLTSLGHKTIHGTNMLIVRTCDGAEHASLLQLPPRIHRLTLRWDVMDMLSLQGQSGKHAYQMTKHRVHFFLACPGRRGACRRSLDAAAACMLAVIPITTPLSCCFICSWLSCPVHAKIEWKELVPQICAFACTIDAFCCLCFLQIKVDRDVKDKPDQCVS